MKLAIVINMYALDPYPSHVTLLQTGLVPTVESVRIKFQVLLFQVIVKIFTKYDHCSSNVSTLSSDNFQNKAIVRPLDKSVKLKIPFLISQLKQMLWVLKRTVSMRPLF